MQGAVLIIDDEKKLAGLLSRILSLEGYNVFQAHTAKDGLKVLNQEDIDVVLSDVKLPDINGVELVRLIKQSKPEVEVINLTAFGSIQDGVAAIKKGAFDYITKGDDNDRIIPLLAQAMEKAKAQKRDRTAHNKHVQDGKGFLAITGESESIKVAIEMARRVSRTDTTVLLQGETGTGKEVFARAIHLESPRSDKAFVAVNCSGFSQELLESELFGYKAGAFTGAIKDKKGLFDEANGGTIFLDEIGEMSLPLQAKMLRVLESRSFIKVGDTQTTSVDVRIIAATNRNLQAEAEKGNFRDDLFYRLSVFTIALPPLAERKGDIEILAAHYLREFGEKASQPHLIMTPPFVEALKAHSWKGNIRELKNVIERVAILADGHAVGPELLPAEFNSQGSQTVFDMQSIEKQHIKKVLQYTGGNKTEAARLLGIGLTTLYRKLEEYKI
ncbi:sigma-54-dependent transcriptional regulator [Arcticibacter sp. MXS-1]|uniref:sigma-54-dependent transcriptional regulator n=1 Tax=Arcticibacter sp. MXS-1 TaxID=3341726 RepID=UPI0035A8B460